MKTSVNFGGLSILNYVVFVLIVGEKLGWRGYALPRLLAERSALAVSLILHSHLRSTVRIRRFFFYYSAAIIFRGSAMYS